MITITNISTDTTFGSGDDGNMFNTTASLILTIPAESTHKFVKGDRIEVFNTHSSPITFTEEVGVNVRSKGNQTIAKNGHVTFFKRAGDKWFVWGDLI